jgi:hypothetical protein
MPDDDEGQGDDAIARDGGAAANGPPRLSELAAVAAQPTRQKSMTIRLTLRAEGSAPAQAGAAGNRTRARKRAERHVSKTLFVALTLLWLFASAFMCQGAPVIDSDICVYGATSGGVVAAVAAARLGKNVVLVAYNNHVGGMSSGGLGVTDHGNTSSIGGIAAEFYQRVGQAYGSASPVYWFEPYVAGQTFWQMLSEAGVPVYTNQLLAAATMSDQTITQITMDDGTIYRAKEFIDTTYEGDLMAMAGVTFTVGREATTR